MIKKCYEALSKYAVLYLFLPWFCSVSEGLVNWIYKALSEIAPSIFASYNQVTQKEEYEALAALLSLIAVFIAVFAINFLCAIYDNERYEELVKATDGLYRLPRVLPAYLKTTLLRDVAAPVLPHLLALSLSLVQYPERMEGFIAFYFAPQRELLAAFGFASALLFSLLVAVAARLLAAPIALKRYRGLWMTSFEEE